jgi:hypothetical protein
VRIPPTLIDEFSVRLPTVGTVSGHESIIAQSLRDQGADTLPKTAQLGEQSRRQLVGAQASDCYPNNRVSRRYLIN